MQAPEDYKQAGLIMCISAGLKLCGIFLIWHPICCPFILASLGVGTWELMTGLKVKDGQHVANVKTVSIVGLVGACLMAGLGIPSIIAAIIVIVFLSKPEVTAFINGEQFAEADAGGEEADAGAEEADAGAEEADADAVAAAEPASDAEPAGDADAADSEEPPEPTE